MFSSSFHAERAELKEYFIRLSDWRHGGCLLDDLQVL